MSTRAPERSGIRDLGFSHRIEQDLVRLRALVLERHDIRLPIDDPLCIEFTVFSHVVERTVAALQQERAETVEELRSVLQSANYSVRAVLEDASKPLAKAMSDTFDPRAVAGRITAEVFDDLRRECGNTVREARRIMLGAVGLTLTASFLVLYLASQRLAAAEALFHLAAADTSETIPPPPEPPPYDQASQER